MQKTASVHGQGNVVVQIVGDGNAVTIAGATALRLVSYLGPDYADAPADPAMAGPPATPRPAERRQASSIRTIERACRSRAARRRSRT